MIKTQRDIIIIGAGLSGSSAALEASRAGFDVLVFSKPGDPGYWARANKIPYYPGLAENISGMDLINHTKKQAENCGAVFHDFLTKEIVETSNHTFQIKGVNSEVFDAPVVIIASGVSKDEHFLAGEKEMVGRGVYYSVYNEAPSLKHQSSAIIGKSEEAGRAALYLSRYTEKIYFVVPSSKLDASEHLVRELESNKKIELLLSSSIKKLNGENELYSITILNAGNERELKTRSVFIYTYNLVPVSDFAKNVIKTDPDTGRIMINSDFSTSVRGLFACGDVLTGTLQNPSVSIAQGIIAAINAEKLLRA